MSTTRDFRLLNQSFVSKLSSTRPYHVLLETLPSNCEVDGSSVVQSRQDDVFDGPGEANSDSGDSVFITQKPVPGAVRSGKRGSSRLRSNSKIQQEDPLKQDAETSSFLSTSDEEQKTHRKKKKHVFKAPKIRFSFLTKTNKMKPVIANARHMKLQLYAMGGFISSVHDLWKSFELGGDLAESLPTVDMDGESISPISEEEEETEDEDIKVVERKCFVTSMATRSQLWNGLNKRSSKQRIHTSALNTSQKEQQRTVYKVFTKMPLKEMLSSATKSSDDGDKGLGIIRTSSPQEMGTQTERPDTKSPLRKIRKRLLNNSSDLYMGEQSQSGSTVCGFKNQNTPQRDVNNETLSSESEVKKRKKKDKCVEEGMKQSQETQGQCDAVPSVGVDITEELTLTNETETSVSNRRKKKKIKKKSAEKEEEDKQEQSDEALEEDSVGSSKTGTDGKEKKKRNDVGMECVKTSTAAEPPTDDGNMKKKKKKRLNSDVPQTSTEHQEYLENTEASQSVESNFTKKKKKKKKSAEEEVIVQQEQSNEELLEDSVVSSKIGTGKKEKKKKNDVEMKCVGTSTATKTPTDDGNIKKKKKKKCLNSDVPQTSTEHQEYLENTEASQESVESKFTKRKKKKNSTFDTQIEEDCVNAGISNDAATMETNADITVKKKKKGISETEDISHTAEEDKNIDDTQKEGLDAEPKTKKKKRRGNSSKIIQENSLSPVKYSVSVQKKKTSSSFLTADEEENDGQTHEKHLPDVSVDAFAATSADATGSLGESKDRGKKKKTTRSAGLECAERELQFKEPKETSESVVKKKKKRRRNDSELMSSTERLESLADAEDSQAVVLSKKKKKYAQETRETLVQCASPPSNEPGIQTPKEKKREKNGKLMINIC